MRGGAKDFFVVGAPPHRMWVAKEKRVTHFIHDSSVVLITVRCSGEYIDLRGTKKKESRGEEHLYAESKKSQGG